MAYNNKNGLFEGYIYKIINDVNDKVYIGQTTNKISIRWTQHKSAAKNLTVNSILYRAMNKYGINKFHIKQIKEYYAKTYSELIQILNIEECKYILEYNSLNPNGYNMTKGGENTSERMKTPVDAYFANGTLYKSYSYMNEIKNDFSDISSISACCRGERYSSMGFIWRYHSDPFDKFPIGRTQEELDRINFQIPVDKYNLDGVFIDSYESMYSGLKSVLNNDARCTTQIKNCCEGIANTAFGFVWRYKGQPFDMYKMKNDCYKSVDVYDLKGNFVGSYESISCAIKNLHINVKSTGHISQCCEGKRKSAYGYIWRYKGEPLEKYNVFENKRGKSGRLINKYTLDGIYICTYDTATEAAYSVGLKTATMIYSCAKYISEQCRGYKWYYANDPNQPDKTKIIN